MMVAIPDSTGRPIARMVALAPVRTLLFCRTHRKFVVCLGSKYRFCVPQNRLTEQGAAGHGSGKEAAR